MTGVALVTKKLHEYRDRKRHEVFLAEKQRMADEQRRERAALDRRHELQRLDLERRRRALDRVEERELRSLDTAKQNQIRVRQRGGAGQMPAFTLEMSPPGRKAVPHKPKNRHIGKARLQDRPKNQTGHEAQRPAPPDKSTPAPEDERADEKAAAGKGGRSSKPRKVRGRKPLNMYKAFMDRRGLPRGKGSGQLKPDATLDTKWGRYGRQVDPVRQFNEAARTAGDEERHDSGDADAPHPEAKSKVVRAGRRKRADLFRDFTKASGTPSDDGDDSGGDGDDAGCRSAHKAAQKS